MRRVRCTVPHFKHMTYLHHRNLHFDTAPIDFDQEAIDALSERSAHLLRRRLRNRITSFVFTLTMHFLPRQVALFTFAWLASSEMGVSTGVTATKITAHRPDASTWKRTTCGSPAGSHPAVPPGPYTIGIDFPGSDMPPCGSDGCILNQSATPDDCETLCNTTKGCVAYIFAPATCSGKSGPICWVKSAADGNGKKATCRNSRKMGNPASEAADIPSQWAADVDPRRGQPLTQYPRPQMVRSTTRKPSEMNLNEETVHALRDEGDPATWNNLNGLWEWQPTTADAPPPFGTTLNGSILVPFPVESCLSGVAPGSSSAVVMHMWYRLTFDADLGQGNTLLHFGAIDWQSKVYVNKQLLGNHTGGYDGFSFDVTKLLQAHNNELLVYVYDPSDTGAQPNGKQRIAAISNPSGDTYTPSSGIWQTVWLEHVPAQYIRALSIDQASETTVTVGVVVDGPHAAEHSNASELSFTVYDATGRTVAVATGQPNVNVAITVPSPQLWSTTSPYLYTLGISMDQGDSVVAYFGLRTFALGAGHSATSGKRPLLNGNFTFMAGFLDQSFWPDGLYTAPTDEALAFDVTVVPTFGLNMIRLHQKINPERWYYHADKTGVVVFQDMVQKYGGASEATVAFFVSDMTAAILGRKNHPCIVQFETFNEGDCWTVFKTKPYDVPGIVSLAKELAPTHLIDTDSGGKANDLHIGDVDDIHSYPAPGDPAASSTQYAMVGEFGGLGAFVTGKEWLPHGCFAYEEAANGTDQANKYIAFAQQIASRVDHLSASVYTQTTDLERECDGFLNYDRTTKFTAADTAAIKKANEAIIEAGKKL
eukprot:m.16204 g.16204  ORF g.16204 m.16204 type:complete len:821 (+) comp10918_c0_seq2:311-2773(+)